MATSRNNKKGPSKWSGKGRPGGDKDFKRKPTGKDSPKKSYGKRGPVQKRKHSAQPVGSSDGKSRLNKFIANAGICSRREADELIAAGLVQVNGEVITEMGFKVSPTDEVKYNGGKIRSEKKVYLLLNKPKDYITTLDDPRERKTVYDLIRKACKERVYPVGRLDRNTTGVLLFTNDGELTKQLTHPKHGVKKLYHVTLNKNFKTADLEKLAEGLKLEDGFIKPDKVDFVASKSTGGKNEVGIEIHSGKNRVVRRIFEHLGYDVLKLDRVLFAGLTKKDLPRGKWRFLTDKEVAFIQMLQK